MGFPVLAGLPVESLRWPGGGDTGSLPRAGYISDGLQIEHKTPKMNLKPFWFGPFLCLRMLMSQKPCSPQLKHQFTVGGLCLLVGLCFHLDPPPHFPLWCSKLFWCVARSLHLCVCGGPVVTSVMGKVQGGCRLWSSHPLLDWGGPPSAVINPWGRSSRDGLFSAAGSDLPLLPGRAIGWRWWTARWTSCPGQHQSVSVKKYEPPGVRFAEFLHPKSPSPQSVQMPPPSPWSLKNKAGRCCVAFCSACFGDSSGMLS